MDIGAFPGRRAMGGGLIAVALALALALVGTVALTGSPASAAGSSAETVITSRAPESRSCLVISPPGDRLLMVVTVTPARNRPWNTVT